MSYIERKMQLEGEELLQYKATLAESLKVSEAGQWVNEILQDIREEAINLLIQSKESDVQRGTIACVDTLRQRLNLPAWQLSQVRRLKKDKEGEDVPMVDIRRDTSPGFV